MIKTGMLQSLNGKSWIDMDNGAFSLGAGALQWSAANGFKAVSAERLTGQNATISAKIGKNQSGIDLFALFDSASVTPNNPTYAI